MRARPNFRLASCKQFRLHSTITSKKSYYEILGVDRRADSKEIRRVFLIKGSPVLMQPEKPTQITTPRQKHRSSLSC